MVIGSIKKYTLASLIPPEYTNANYEKGCFCFNNDEMQL